MLDSADARIPKQCIWFYWHTRFVEFQRFLDDIHSQAIPKLETVSQRLFGIIHPDGDVIKVRRLNAGRKRGFGESVGMYRW